MTDGTGEITEEVASTNRMFDFAGIAHCWGLADVEQRTLLGDVDSETFERWRLGELEGFGGEPDERLAAIFDIFRLLQNVYVDPVEADGWVWKPDEGLNGQRPLDVMQEEGLPGIERVRERLRLKQAA